MADAWTVHHEVIPETVVPGKRLGRNVKRDSRSLAYAYKRTTAGTLRDTLWPRHIPILDQGDVGSCTGNAETGALACDPLFGALPAGSGVLNEAMALKLYSAAETIDGDGPYPPNDYGSSGTSVCQAALDLKLISGYTHAAGIADVCDALQSGPVILGMNWYSSFDTPASSGLVTITSGAYVRGGHEVLARGLNVANQLILLDNSWGTSWGDAGSFTMSWVTLERLLSEQGDATVSVPLTAPAPVPAPPVAGADQTLWLATKVWAGQRHRGGTAKAAKAVLAWGKAKGYS